MSDISLDLYKVFYYICEFGSISKAANYLYVSQPAVTRKISELEDILEATLIYRTPRGIELTDYGKKLYNEIKDSIEKLNSVGGKFSKAQKEQNTVIRIDAGGYMTVKGLLLNVINQFSRKYPKIKYQISTLPFAEGFQKLKEGKIDIKLVSEKRIKDLPENIVIKNGYDVHSIFIINN